MVTVTKHIGGGNAIGRIDVENPNYAIRLEKGREGWTGKMNMDIRI